jgi:hypothetical protein
MYENKIGRVLSLNAFYFDIYNIDFNQKDFDTAKKHSYGLEVLVCFIRD